MKLIYFKDHVANFGDELNTYMWQGLLPEGFLDEDENELFIGIGSILWDNYPKQPRKYVLGSGYAGYTGAPDVHDGSWDVVFVRGPRTAERLNLPPEKAICDSAILLRALDLPAASDPIDVGFMPHYESLDRGLWREACRLAGVRLIDPTDPVEKVISELRGTRVLITEAMHGAIVADALRTPWIAALPINPGHHKKWQDWSGALSLQVRHHALQPSSLMELWVGMSGGRGDPNGRSGRLSRSVLAKPVNSVLAHRAAGNLRKLARQEPQLSSDAKIAEVTERALAALQGFVSARSSRGVAA
ncbi:polysaccharide pyruvyl transferase family protein [Aquamicrobium sp. LC103]|uniref:polysaccharide pyruvyl transferase family protein n=1 Tax=Aquamicrobium sp. LC103 TaxID=1120658 RepID=UPI00063EC0E4|nr:polysaccharide pyruvyl transferase family protein [Aquamicrobium sp. LC103]TKT69324.1 polysaccharide pyruvyl transferase family protein [Aquamicrobium sp. LC103]